MDVATLGLAMSPSMSDAAGRHAETIAALRSAVLVTPGAWSVDERAAAESAAPTGTVADAYLERVRHASYRIIDADIDSLTTAGMTEDAILELSGAGLPARMMNGIHRAARLMTAVSPRIDRRSRSSGPGPGRQARVRIRPDRTGAAGCSA